ncbi:glycosyltransferase [Rhodococcus sp. USK13]|uniref:glycosyltransferase family 2 protein n=1 Tax=Rhodococcus sp. USK13 TaxID=2806442 RepID=UPI001BD17232|nr:glycosyltransferase [Rhodococcus sp. USK13]
MTHEIRSVSFVIVAFRNNVDHLVRLCESLLVAADSLKMPAQVLLVLNDDPAFPRTSNVTVIQGHGNVGFAAGIEKGVLASVGEYLVFVNPDCETNVEEFKRFLSEVRLDGGIAIPMLYNSIGEFDYMPYENWTFTPGRMLSARLCRRLSAINEPRLPKYAKISGAFVGMERQVALQLGTPFDTAFFLYAEDRDMTDRVRAAGIPITLLRNVRITHIGGESGKSVSELVARCKADGSLRVAYRRFGRPGALLFAIDQWLLDGIKYLLGRSSPRSANAWSARRWREANYFDPGPLTQELLSK